MKIEVIGSGCKKCKMLFELTEDIVGELGLNTIVSYNTDISRIINMGLINSPVLTINDNPVLVGLLPGRDKLKEIISENI